MNWILDLIIVAIVILSVIITAKKGFVKTVFNVVGVIAAIVIAFMICGPIADFVYDKAVEPAIHETVENAVNEELEKDNTDIEKKIEDSSLPQFVKNKLSQIDLKSYGSKSSEIADAICVKVIKPITVGFIKAISFIILFIILSIIAKFLSKSINKVCSFSIMGKANKTLGGILGIIYGLALSALFVTAVRVIISLNGGVLGVTDATIEQTYVFKNLLALLPFNVK